MKPISIVITAAVVLALLAVSYSAFGQGFFKKLAPTRTFTFESLPQNVDELKALPEADLQDPHAVGALTVAALTRYGESEEDCIEMLNFLKGPEPLSGYEKQFIRERLQGKGYKPFSYFKGATPANNYTPSRPYKIKVDTNQYSFTKDGSGH